METVVSESQEVRVIESSELPPRFARGWHCLGLSEKYKDGKPHTLNAFGEKLVIWTGANGKISILDAYCRHMGGDLSQGTVKGDEIACPFHDWRWGGDGRCKAIPYSRRVPMRARTRTWQTLDQDGLLFVWHDPEGNPPPAEVAIPRIKGATSEGWTDWVWNDMVIHTNTREVVDNVVDMAHFFYVHGNMPTYFKNVFEGHIATQYFDGVVREDMLPEVLDPNAPKMEKTLSQASYFGPAFMINELDYIYDQFELDTVLLNTHYPIDENSFVLSTAVIVEKNPDVPGDPEEIANEQIQWVLKGFMEDVEIWKNKARIDNPLLCEEDGPVYQLRRWYEQFFRDVADVEPEMTDRFEYELDTTRPMEAWQKEVAENLAARKAAAEQLI